MIHCRVHKVYADELLFLSMKKLLILIICCTVSDACLAQKDTVFLDEESEVITDRNK